LAEQPILVNGPGGKDFSYSLGRLGQSVEGRAKRRIFAIGNYVAQRLLRPLHKWLAALLRMLPMDGTFNQHKPLWRLTGSKVAYSYDLSAATDRFPVGVIHSLVKELLGREYADCAILGALVTHVFDVPFVKKDGHNYSKVSFLTGQALGFYGSWTSFALSHHMIVWWAAEQVYPGLRFDRYALLGDDIVIADERVAIRYAGIMDSLGVKISPLKSLISHTGCAEFAKRFVVRDLSTDLSPTSARSLLGCHHPFGIQAVVMAHPTLPLRTVLRLAGCGYRVRSRMKARLSKKYLRILDMVKRSQLPTGLWLADDCALNPYHLGRLVTDIILSIRIPEPKWPPHYYDRSSVSWLKTMGTPFFEPDNGWASYDFCEVTMMRGTMKRWLAYHSWYARLHQDLMFGGDPLELLERALNPPVFHTSYKVPSLDNLELNKFGISFKVKDRYRGLVHKVRILALPSSHGTDDKVWNSPIWVGYFDRV
jgi:hypothetical protein